MQGGIDQLLWVLAAEEEVRVWRETSEMCTFRQRHVKWGAEAQTGNRESRREEGGQRRENKNQTREAEKVRKWGTEE